MIHLTDMTGLASSAIAITAAFLLLPGVARIPKSYRIALACTVAIAALIPSGGLSPAAYVRGALGDLSITTLVLLMLAISHRLSGWQPRNAKPRLALLSLVVLAAVGLYPMALGIGYFDPYRLGYGDVWLMGALLTVALIAAFRQLPLVACCIALAVFAWSVGWYESTNLWDYLLDPLLTIYATGALIKLGARQIKPKATQQK